MRNSFIRQMVLSALLIALAIVIPMFSPKIVYFEPFSATLASHVPVIIAMFINPFVAGAVAIGSGIGFFLTAPLPIAARAFTHIIFAIIGAFLIGFVKDDSIALFTKKSSKKSVILILKLVGIILLTGVIHGVSESIAILPFGFKAGNTILFGLDAIKIVAIGTFIHHIFDFIIAIVIIIPLSTTGIFKSQNLKKK